MWFGLTLAALGELLAHPRRLRPRELSAKFEQVCVNAIPVVALMALLMGVTIAYLLGRQAEKDGANIFAVDGVGIGMAREFAPIIALLDDPGLTVLRVTHDLDTLLTVVDRLIVQADGRVLADGPVAEVIAFDHPWTRSCFAVRTMVSERAATR